MAQTIQGLYTQGEDIADHKAPEGPLEGKWEKRKFEARLVNPANRRKLSVIVVGTGLAVYLAAANRPRMVILESPYYSFLDLAAYHYPLIPRPLLRLLLRYPLRTDQWIAKVECPIYLFHGERDEIIPHASSVRLLPLIRSERMLTTIPSGGHNDLGEHDLYQRKLDQILRGVE